VAWLSDRKWAYIRLEGRSFGDVPLNVELKLEVWDSPNSAGIVIDADDIHVGPSDYVPWLKDRKWCHIRMEGTTYGDVPLNLELKLEVWDSPNSAGVITDAIRCLKLGLDRSWSAPWSLPRPTS
ncbi:MAG TPA: hypothetical protein VK600_03925, partial [Candidatus Saccharimonadales bacterium]|nr:hypothetical protein [Candidatus Saccharimonadales bacterium]